MLRSTLESLPSELVESIGIYTALFSLNGLLNLQLCSKYLHQLLAFDLNPALYACICKIKYDTDAVVRRTGTQIDTPLNFAQELKKRTLVLHMISNSVKERKIPNEDVHQLLETLWTAYMMMLENDGKNAQRLTEIDILDFLHLFYARHMITLSSLQAQLPPETTARALVIALFNLLATPEDLDSNSQGELLKRLYIYKPYTFAAHRYQAFYGPWKSAHLPAECPSWVEHDLPVLCHFGQPLHIRSPTIFSSAFELFSRQRVTEDRLDDGTHAPSPIEEPTQPSTGTGSEQYDLTFSRLSLCTNPNTSPGLPPSAFRGMFTGKWEGKFAFFDFDAYRAMLSGNLKAIYEGAFGDQSSVWKLEEKLIRLKEGQMEGGDGPRLNAGFPIDDAPNGFSKWLENEDVVHADEELHPDGRYEIVLYGTGHSAWGNFRLKGRVRTWDGLTSIVKEYVPDGRGKWLYRGYLQQEGVFVGRWRDTFTTEDVAGYEGPFMLKRRCDL